MRVMDMGLLLSICHFPQHALAPFFFHVILCKSRVQWLSNTWGFLGCRIPRLFLLMWFGGRQSQMIIRMFLSGPAVCMCAYVWFLAGSKILRQVSLYKSMLSLLPLSVLQSFQLFQFNLDTIIYLVNLWQRECYAGDTSISSDSLNAHYPLIEEVVVKHPVKK